MRCWHYLLCATMLLLSGVIPAEVQSNELKVAVREFWALKSTDGRSHEILAIAAAKSGKTDVVYVVEGVSDRLIEGSEAKSDGEFLLWKLDSNGQVLHQEFIRKMPPGDRRPRPCVSIVPLPAPEKGAILVGIFGEQFVWSFLRVDEVGKIIKSITLVNEGEAFLGAVLAPDMKAVLLAGQYGFGGSVWKVDLDGKTLWKQMYESRTDMSKKELSEKVASQFHGIALADDQGGFIVAGDFGALNKFGVGKKSVWLVRCDKTGKVVSETTFPGRLPSICNLGKDQFAVLYDAGSMLEADSRVRVVDLELKQQWEKKAQFTALFNDRPTISAIPSARGFVLAGCNIVKENEISHWNCQFFQYDTSGQIVSSISMPVAKNTFLHAKVVCGTDHAYVATQTKGAVPWDLREASIFEIPLKMQTQ